MTNKYRDRAALMAMQGMLAVPEAMGRYEQVAFDAYNQADAMLAERTKRYGEEHKVNAKISDPNFYNEKTDWIEWNGGECPVDGDTVVEVELQDGDINKDIAKLFNWSHADYVCKILRYRVVAPPVPQGDK